MWQQRTVNHLLGSLLVGAAHDVGLHVLKREGCVVHVGINITHSAHIRKDLCMGQDRAGQVGWSVVRVD
eukprot:352473-Chlamydomonas_euryale.AAC.8